MKSAKCKVQSVGGFTLLEVMLSIAAITVLSAFSLPIFRTIITKNDLDVATVTVTQTLRRAQIQSQTVDGDISWGLKVQSGSITLFKGASSAARDSAFDEVFDMPTNITPSGLSEIVFAKLTGFPQTTGTTTFVTANDSKTVTINEKGTISY